MVKLLVDSGAQLDNKDNVSTQPPMVLHCDSSFTISIYSQPPPLTLSLPPTFLLTFYLMTVSINEPLADSQYYIIFSSQDGQTALHHASRSGQTDVVQLLVDCGAHLDNKDNVSDEPSMVLHCDSSFTVSIYSQPPPLPLSLPPTFVLTFCLMTVSINEPLADSQCSIIFSSQDGQTALHHASRSGQTDVVKLLVDSGAHLDNKDNVSDEPSMVLHCDISFTILISITNPPPLLLLPTLVPLTSLSPLDLALVIVSLI